MIRIAHTLILLCFPLLLVGLMSHMANGQFELRPYPSPEELEKNVFDPSGFVSVPLSAEDIHQNFSNIKDLDWLEPIAKEHRVILLGETHYYQYIQHLRNRLLFALNTVDHYPTLILERPYSTTPFLNHYLDIARDDDAEAFARDIQEMLVDGTDMQLLRHLRRWNTLHPDRKIQVGCSDIEHHYGVTFRQILFPYFASVETAVAAEMPERPADSAKAVERLLAMFDEMADTPMPPSHDALNQAFHPLEDLLAIVKEQRIVGTYPFLTPDYLARVIDNLKSTYTAYTQDFTPARQHAIIRNLTDPRFLGTCFTTGKVVLHGGRQHAATRARDPRDEQALWEGIYLTHEFPPTQEQTFSILMQGMALSSLLEMNDVEISPGGQLYQTQYDDFLRYVQQAINEGMLVTDTDYLPAPADASDSPPFDDFTILLLRLANDRQRQPFVLQAIPWTRLIEQAQQHSPAGVEELMQARQDFEHYDLNIIVPVSPLVRPIHQK